MRRLAVILCLTAMAVASLAGIARAERGGITELSMMVRGHR